MSSSVFIDRYELPTVEVSSIIEDYHAIYGDKASIMAVCFALDAWTAGGDEAKSRWATALKHTSP
jgi:hypothetical protein